MEKELKEFSNSLTSEQVTSIFRDLVEWNGLRPLEADDPVVENLLTILASNLYGGLIREGFIGLTYDTKDQCWHVTITVEGLTAWHRRVVQ